MKELKKLKSLITLANAQNLIRGVGLIQLLDKLIKEVEKVKPLTDSQPVTKPDQKKKPVQKKTPAQKKKSGEKIGTAQKIKSSPKQTPTTKQASKSIRKLTTPKKPVNKLRFPRLRFALPTKKKGSRQGYIVNIKKGNKIVSQTTTTLPRNRAINLMRKTLDNTIAASGSIVPRGRTSFVDVGKTILAKKFRAKRSKKTKVLKNVEKRKFRKDKKGETRKKR